MAGSQITYTGTGVQSAVVLGQDNDCNYLVTSDAGTPVFTVEVQLNDGGAWGSASSSSGTTVGEAFALNRPIYAFRINISSLGGASEVYLDYAGVKN